MAKVIYLKSNCAAKEFQLSIIRTTGPQNRSGLHVFGKICSTQKSLSAVLQIKHSSFVVFRQTKLCQPQESSYSKFRVNFARFKEIYKKYIYLFFVVRKWIPGCGVELIANSKPSKPARPIDALKMPDAIRPALSTNCMEISTQEYIKHINIFTQFGDLSPSQMLTLFTQFINWPGYRRSSFLPSMENSLIKMETSHESIIEDITFEEQDEVEVTRHPVTPSKPKEVIKEVPKS